MVSTNKNKCSKIILLILIILFILIIVGPIYMLYTNQSYINDYTRNNYSVLVINNSSKIINKADLTVFDPQNNSDVEIIVSNDIQSGEYRKISVNINNEHLKEIAGSSYNVNIKFTVDGSNYNVPAGYFTSAWGGFIVLEVMENKNSELEFVYKSNEKDKNYKKMLKRHYYNPYETSWFE